MRTVAKTHNCRFFIVYKFRISSEFRNRLLGRQLKRCEIILAEDAAQFTAQLILLHVHQQGVYLLGRLAPK